jgi:hypothetical protein
MQESKLNPRTVHPNGLWESIFQQDASYPGRRDPNTNISEFFNRLDRKDGPGSPDIWKSIFWLQQRPGEPSAEAALANGRKGYLVELQSQLMPATRLYNELTAACSCCRVSRLASNLTGDFQRTSQGGDSLTHHNGDAASLTRLESA